MAGKTSLFKNKKIRLLVWSIPVGLMLSSAFLNLRPVIQQGMMGVMLIWMYLGIFSWMGA